MKIYEFWGEHGITRPLVLTLSLPTPLIIMFNLHQKKNFGHLIRLPLCSPSFLDCQKICLVGGFLGFNRESLKYVNRHD